MNNATHHFPRTMPVLSGLFGILLLLPATWFLLALFARVCFGATTWYYSIAPSFLQSPFDLFAWHKAQFIFCCLLLAVIGNLPATLQIRLGQGRRWLLGFKPKGHWLNTAIAFQSLLLLLVLTLYTMIQHIRY
jgi:hypothetical protein